MIVAVAYARPWAGSAGATEDAGHRRGHVDPYPLAVRPLAAAPSAAPVVDLRVGAGRGRAARRRRHRRLGTAVDYLEQFGGTGATVARETIKPFDRRPGADHDQLDRVLAALDDGRPVAFYGWWPTEGAAATTEILGIDAMEVPPPDRKSGRAGRRPRRRHRRLRPPRRLPGRRLRDRAQRVADRGGATGATATCRSPTCGPTPRSCAPPAGGRIEAGTDGGPGRRRRSAGAGPPRLPAVAPRDAVDVAIDRQARCADQRGR